MSATADKSRGRAWHKVTMSVAKADADAVRRAIQSKFCCGIQSEDEAGDCEHLEAYFNSTIEASELRKRMEIVAELISAAGGRAPRLGKIETVPEQDWGAEWRKTWKPVRVSKGLVVCPSWEKFPLKQGETVVHIYPKMAFGTGSHATTRLCLCLLEKHMPKGAALIDIGSGSGILAIAAVKLGARRVTAVEMDDDAIENAEENCRINRVRSRVRIIHAPFGPSIRGKFDLGVCNMLAHIIEPLLDDITRLLTGKSLIISGISKDSAPEFKQSFKRRGWRIRETLKDAEWLGFFATHEGE